MAVRFKSSDLREIIRSVVREEMRSVVTEVINEVMTERYMKKVVVEAIAESRAPARPPKNLRELVVQGEEEREEDTPEVLGNDDEGIYQQSPLKREAADPAAVRRKLREAVQGEDPFFAGTVPLDQQEARHEEGVPLTPAMEKMASRWKELADGMERVATAHRPMSEAVSQEALERRLAEKRKLLEVPVK